MYKSKNFHFIYKKGKNEGRERNHKMEEIKLHQQNKIENKTS